MTYLEGQTVTLRATFKDTDGDLIDPSSVTLTVESPAGTVTTPATTNPSVGVYESQVTLSVEGWWTYRYEGDTAEGSAVCEGTVCALESALASV